MSEWGNAALVLLALTGVTCFVLGSYLEARDAQRKREAEAAEDLRALGQHVTGPDGTRFRIVEESHLDGSVCYRVQRWRDYYPSERPRWEDVDADFFPPRADLSKAQSDLDGYFARLRARLVAGKKSVWPTSSEATP